MNLAEVDSRIVCALGTAIGLACGVAGARYTEVLLRRYELVPSARSGLRFSRIAVVALSTVCGLAFAHVLGQQMADSSLAYALVLLTVNVGLASSVIAAAAVDLEH